jgi:hypothetical protein
MTDTSTTPAQALEAIRTYFQNLNADRAQFRDWAAGSVSGGPNGDGNYPLQDFTGNIALLPCPAKIAALASAIVPSPLLAPVIVSAATHTVTSADYDKLLRCTASGGCIITVPSNLPIGFHCRFRQAGAGAISFIAGDGVTLRGFSGSPSSAGQWAQVFVEVDIAGEVNLSGGIS